MELPTLSVARCTPSGAAYPTEDMAQRVEMETVPTRFTDQYDINCRDDPDSYKR
jgi:hypothetical protein